MMAGAVLALALAGPALASDQSTAPGEKAHYDKTHHDNPGENNCNKFRDQCKYDASCDCYYRMSSPPPSDKGQPTSPKSDGQRPRDRGAHSAPSQSQGQQAPSSQGQQAPPDQTTGPRAGQG
jgi:hypothetical protein